MTDAELDALWIRNLRRLVAAVKGEVLEDDLTTSPPTKSLDSEEGGDK